jgi:hypothetical protein
MDVTATIQLPAEGTSISVAYVPGSADRGDESSNSLAGVNGYHVAVNGPSGLLRSSFATHTCGDPPVTTPPLLVIRSKPK